MFLERKIKASSIAEIVIALSIIAICFGVASLIFLRSTNTTSKFMDIKQQTEFQSYMLKQLYKDEAAENGLESGAFEVEEIQDETNDSIIVIRLPGSDSRTIWEQQVLKKKRR